MLGVDNYRNTEEFYKKYSEERAQQLNQYRKEHPSYIPLEELGEYLKEFFEKHNVTHYRTTFLIKGSVEALGFEVQSFNFGNGDNSKKFSGIDLKDTSLNDFLPLFKEEVEKEFKEFVASFYRSEGEKELFDYVKSLTTEEVFFQNRSLIRGEDGKKMEVDIYIPSKKLAIEYNGCYWHNIDRCKDINYHLSKTLACEKSGIRLIHIWDYEWIYNKEKIQSFLRNILSDKIKIVARECEIRRLFLNEEKTFLNTYHLQGYRKSEVCYGLFHKNELIQLMSFTKARYRKDIQWELLRLCTKEGYTIVEGSQKLLRTFIEEYKPNNLISYCDRNKFRGDVYSQLGFKEEKLKPDAFYVRFSKDSYQRFTANSLVRGGADKLTGTDEGRDTDNEEIVRNEGFFKVYGVGQQAFIWKKNKKK